MSEPRGQRQVLVERYLGLESFEVIEELLDCCGATVDTRAVLLLRRRLHEERVRLTTHEARGYLRMAEKSTQLIASIEALLADLSGGTDGDDGRADAQRGRAAGDGAGEG